MPRATEIQETAQQKEQEIKEREEYPETSTSRSSGEPLSKGRSAFPFFGSAFPFMQRFSEEMDRLFDDFGLWGGLSKRGLRGRATTNWIPRIEVFERQGKFVVRAELPGVTKEDVEVEITDDALAIQGERRQTHEEKKEGYYRSECSYGHFYRTVPLPEGVKTENATAKFQDGVLEIEMMTPERPETRGRRIEIQEGTIK
jgi:HSP20 family protein